MKVFLMILFIYFGMVAIILFFNYACHKTKTPKQDEEKTLDESE